jgi:hypothetical protein
VQCATAVSQHRAAGGSPEDIAERVNSVLERHAEAPIMPLQGRRFSLAPLPEVAADSSAATLTKSGTISSNLSR